MTTAETTFSSALVSLVTIAAAVAIVYLSVVWSRRDRHVTRNAARATGPPAAAVKAPARAAGTDKPPSAPRGSGKKKEEVTHARLLHTIKGITEPIEAIALCAADGGTVAAASSDRTLRLFSGVEADAAPVAVARANVLTTNGRLPDHGTALSISATGKNLLLATSTGRTLLAYSLTAKGDGTSGPCLVFSGLNSF